MTHTSRVPFHPKRLLHILQQRETLKGVIRAKGFFWIAPQPSISVLFSLAGKASKFEKAGLWWAAIPAEKRPPESNKEFYDWLMKIWEEEYGDRRNELVFIGQDFDKEKLEQGLEWAALTEEERSDPLSWKDFEDPFPPWGKMQEVTEQFEFSLRQQHQQNEKN